MTNSLRLQKAFTFVVAAATIIATAGLTAFVPSQASAASYGDLIKGETLSTVYYYGSDGQRYSFPNEKTYFSWFEDFDGVVEITDEELADITLAGNIVYRPGSRWIKITSDEKTYAVAADGTIHWIESEEVAVGLAGSDWNTFIDDVPDVFFVDYTVGDSLTDASTGYEGMLWTDGTDTYLVWDGELRMVSSAGMSGNMFQDGFVLDGADFDMDSFSMGDDITGELAYLTDVAQLVETEEYAETQEIAVSLSSSSPASSTLVAAQALGHLGSYDFSNSSSSDVVVTKVALNRTGVSADTTLSNTYLFDGWNRLSDSATVSSGVISWNDASGIFTIPAGGTYTIDVRADILTGTSGQTVGVSLDPDNVVYSGSYESTGSAIASATHTIATVTGFGTVYFGATTTPSANSALDPQDDYTLWNNTVTIGSNESLLTALSFRNIGSINAEDLGNWELYVAGVNYGDAVAEEDADGYIMFDLSADPIRMSTGSHVIKVMADIWGGSTRTITVGLRSAADAIFIEEDYDQPILVALSSSSAFSARDAGQQTLASGNVTFTKTTDSASGDVIDGATNASLGSFEVKATGEAMKIESLRIRIDEGNVVTTGDEDTSGTNQVYTLRSGAVYADGVQIGSTAAIAGDGDSTLAYTSYSFGSSFIVYPGSPVTLEIRADIYDSDGTNDIDATDTIQVEIAEHSSVNNALRMTSGSYIDAPSTAVEGNTLTVRTGSLTTSENTSYADQTAVAPKTGYKVGSWTVTAATTESVNLTQLDLAFSSAASEASAAADYTNLYVTYGPEGDENTSSSKSTVSLTANAWSINYTLAPGETIYVNAYATVATSVSDDTDGDDIITPTLDVDGTASDSGTSLDGSAVTGQSITWYASGTFTTALDGGTPVNDAVAGGQTVEAAKYKFTAVRESYTIDQIQVSIGVGGVGVASSAKLYDGSTLLGTAVFAQTSGDAVVNGAALITGLNINVAAGSSKTITAKLVLNDIGVGAGASQQNLALALDSARYSDSTGTVTTDTTDRDGNELYVFNSIPVISQVDLTNSTVVNSQATDLYKFTVTADANGDVAMKQFKLTTTWSDGGTADTLGVDTFKLYKNGSDITTSVLIQDQAGNSVEGAGAFTEADSDLVVTWASEDVISAGETVTYIVRGTPTGFRTVGSDTSGDSVSFYFAADTATNSTKVFLNDGTSTATIVKLHTSAAAGHASAVTYEFIWSDLSASAHSSSTNASSTGDWHNGYLIDNLDLSSETWTK